MTKFEIDKKQSMAATDKFIYPVLQSKFQGGKIFSVEGDEESEILKSLDRISGIDLLVNHGGGLYGVACRCLKYRGRAAFTVRYSRCGVTNCEYDRLKTAISGGGLYPQYFAQCYYNNDNSACVAVIDTQQLLHLIDTFGQIEKNDDVRFLSVDWKKLKFEDFEHWRITPSAPPRKLISPAECCNPTGH